MVKKVFVELMTRLENVSHSLPDRDLVAFNVRLDSKDTFMDQPHPRRNEPGTCRSYRLRVTSSEGPLDINDMATIMEILEEDLFENMYFKIENNGVEIEVM